MLQSSYLLFLTHTCCWSKKKYAKLCCLQAALANLNTMCSSQDAAQVMRLAVGQAVGAAIPSSFGPSPCALLQGINMHLYCTYKHKLQQRGLMANAHRNVDQHQVHELQQQTLTYALQGYVSCQLFSSVVPDRWHTSLLSLKLTQMS